MAHKHRVLINICIILLFLVVNTLQHATRKKITYFSTEHPSVTYVNTKYVKYANLTAKRYGRSDPFYYVALHFHTLMFIDYKTVVHFYFYELLTNVYKRGFIEMHMTICHMIERDNFFGPAVRQNLKPCPLPPGEYHLYNMTIPVEQVPRGFPFIKGRIYANFTYGSDVIIAAGYINIELKQFTRP